MSKGILDQETADSKGLVTYDIYEEVGIVNPGPPPKLEIERRILESGQVTETEMEVIRKGTVILFPKHKISIVWPLIHGRAPNGLSGTLEGWMKGQRG